MIDDPTLIKVISRSPLSKDDKKHWRQLLPKLSADRRERLHHSLTAKTEIFHAIQLIKKALKIISEAEEEAEKEVRQEKKQQLEKEKLLKELNQIKKKEEEIILDKDQLKAKQQETQNQLKAIRRELKKISLEVHGQAPPSYNQNNKPIPQLKK